MEDIDYVRLNYGAVFSSGSRPSERASERAPRRCDATPRAGSKERAEAGEGRKSQRTDFVFPVATLISLRTRIFLPPSRHFLPFSFSTVPIHSPPREWTTVVYEPTSFPIDGHLLTPLDRAIYISRLVSIRIVSINGVKKSSIRTFLSSFSFSLLLLPLPFRFNSASIRGKRIAQLREKLAEKVSLARYVQKPGREISFFTRLVDTCRHGVAERVREKKRGRRGKNKAPLSVASLYARISRVLYLASHAKRDRKRISSS